MSRKGNRNKNKQRTSNTQLVGTSAQTNTQNYYNANGTGYSPGTPPTPSTLFGSEPRLWAFPSGINVQQLPRSTERIGFEKLRNLSENLDAIQLCEQVWCDVARGLEPRVMPRPDLLKDGDDGSQYTSDILKYEKWFSNLGGFMPIHDAMTSALRDQLQIDAVAWHPRRNRGGGLYSLELLDASLIKPLIDNRGAIPEPPYAAFEQYLYGIPQGLYTTDEILYMKETHRTNSVYGVSRVEKFIKRVEMALRKQDKDMARFTDGNLPAGLVEVPVDVSQGWTPKDLEAFRELWNNMYVGNYRQQAKARVGLPGTKYTKIDDDPISVEFDKFLLTIACAAFGVTMADLSFTEDVNRSSGESQAAVTYRRTIKPSALRYASLFTQVLQDYFGDPRFIFTWQGFETQDDFNLLATAHTQLVQSGIESVSDAARALKIPNAVEVPRFIIVKGGGVIMVDSLADPKVQDTMLKSLQEPPQPATPPDVSKPDDTSTDDASDTEDEQGNEDDKGNDATKDNSDTTKKSKVGVK